MSLIWRRRRFSTVERDLILARPQPRDEYMAATVVLFGEQRPTPSTPRRGPATPAASGRRIAALALTFALVAGVVALGGASFGKHATLSAVSSGVGAFKRTFDLSGPGSSAPRFLVGATCTYSDHTDQPDLFEVSTPTPPIVAGTAFTLTITAYWCDGEGNNYPDTSYTGGNLTFSGPGSINGNNPTWPANPVSFTGGSATVSIILVKAESTTITVTDGIASGTSGSFTVWTGHSEPARVYDRADWWGG